ncbi:MAG: putative porin [Verrucomicrobia bacterium]|nr:putative porin [Verrucomicrobiota bacterium]
MGYKQLTTTTVTLAVAALIGAGAPLAQANDAILDLLVKKGVVSQREANDLREQADAQMAQAVQDNSKLKTSSWLQSLTLYGDFRLRDEFNDQFNNAANSALARQAADEQRFRYRLRVGALMELTDWVTLNTRLTTGDSNPNSANQTMMNSGSRKTINLDLAYATLHPPTLNDGPFGLKISGGKMLWQTWEPSFVSCMSQDPDVNPEGVAENLEYKFGEKDRFRLFFNAAQYVLSESKIQEDKDVYMFDQQLGLETKFNDRLKFTTAVGYYVTKNMNQLSPALSTSPNLGNSLGGANYLDDFAVAYGQGELVWTINDKTFLGTPNVVTVSGKVMKNYSMFAKNLTGANAADATNPDQTFGWTTQIAYGANKKKGQWRVAYQYKYMQADATYDAWTDDDWSTGGTDRKGHAFEVTYNLFDWWQLRAGVFDCTKISNWAGNAHDQTGYAGAYATRAQLDSQIKF